MDAVIREVLRLNCPVPSTVRAAKEDVMVPLGKPVRGKNGQMVENVKLRKGTTLFIRRSHRRYPCYPCCHIHFNDTGTPSMSQIARHRHPLTRSDPKRPHVARDLGS